MIATPGRRAPALPIDEQIRRRTEMRVAYFAAHPERIGARLCELESEWDIERALETASSVLSLAGFGLAVAKRRKRWLLLPMAVQGFFLQHAVQGACAPVALLRRLGLRTQTEIDAERYALKALKGDFREVTEADNLDAQSRAERALRAVSNGHAGPRREPEAPLFQPPPEPREKGSIPPPDPGPTS